MNAERCTWCGEDVPADDGFRLIEPEGERRAVFCRLEHVVPWTLQGAHWQVELPQDARDEHEAPDVCAQCGGELGDRRVVLVRHRGEHRIGDAFCELDHALQWAKAGGRWQAGR